MGRLRIWQIGFIVLGFVVLASVTVVGISSSIFRTDFIVVARSILSTDIAKPGIVTEADLANLPEPAQRYLHYTGIVGKEKVNTVRLKQTGAMRQTPADSWKNIKAVEYYSVNSPAYIWMGQMAAGPFSIVSARDSYFNKHGRMCIKMLGIKTIGDVQGEEMDHSALVRYLNEMMWFPTAFLNDNIRWDTIDDQSAKVTIIDGDRNASAVLYFDKKGALTNFVSDRYHEVNGMYVKDTWETPMTGYGEFNGLKLPVKGEAIWKTSSGDFSYINLEITDIEYNTAETYR
jgi:hypothetical protein